MGVRVDECGHQRPTAQVPLLAVPAGERPAVPEGTRVEDALSLESQRLGTLRSGRGHGQDLPPGDDQSARHVSLSKLELPRRIVSTSWKQVP